MKKYKYVYKYVCLHMDVYIKLNHFADSHQKLTRCCGSTILRLKRCAG